MRAPSVMVLTLCAACFGGEGTLGGACERDDDCGGEQSCARSVCSVCDDGVAQAGELCFADPQQTEARAPEAATFAAIDLDGDGVLDLVWPGEDGLVVSLATAGGFAAAQERTFDVTGVWSGDLDGDGVFELLTRDAAGGAALWRANASGELRAVDIDLEPLRGLTGAVLAPDFGVIARVARRVARVDAAGMSSALELDDDVTHLTAAGDLDGRGGADAIAVTGLRTMIGIAATEAGLEQLPGQPFSTDILDPDILDLAPVAWNGDPLGDVVVLFDGGQAQVWLSDGAGGFSAGPVRELSPETTSVLALDVTADRLPDVLGYGPASDLRLAIRRGSDLDAAVQLDDGAWRWVAPMQLGAAPLLDLVAYDGQALSILRRTP